MKLNISAVRRAHTARSLRLFGEAYFLGSEGQPLRYSKGQLLAIQQIQAIADAGSEEPIQAGLMLPRGHGKTTSILMPSILWLQLRKGYPGLSWGSRYAIIATAGTLYKQLSRDIRLILTGMGPLVRDHHGEALLCQDWEILPSKHHPASDDVGIWHIEDFAYYAGGLKARHRRRVSVRGLNHGEINVRGLVDQGQRPDVCWIDDPMKDLEAESREITDRVKHTLKAAIAPALAPRSRMVCTGTPFNDYDLISSIIHKPEEFPSWRRLRLPCYDKKGRPLVPQVWNKALLENRRAEIGSKAFASQYLLNPIGGDVRLFDETWINKWIGPAPPRGPIRVMFCDPSLGRTSKSDLSAIVVLDRDVKGISWILHCSMERRRPAKLVNDYLNLWSQYMPDAHAIEDEGQQELLIPLFRRVVEERSLHVGAVPGLQKSGGVSKVLRIKSLSSEVEFGRLRFTAEGQHRELRDQAIGYQGRPHERDDGLDALEGAFRLAKGQIIGDWAIDDRDTPQSEFAGILDMSF